jgi:cytokinin riboside 5'-monophosphate phosphoribohydrolase
MVLKKMNKNICVYSSSSCNIDNMYFDTAAELGRQIAIQGDTLLFGGGLLGLMGATAKAVHQNNGKVIGVIPKALNLQGVVYESCNELIVTEGLRERKAVMDSKSHAFIALPGGYGTLEELMEIITLKQLGYHNKPVVILNVNGFYQDLLALFEQFIDQHFAKPDCRKLYQVTNDVREALAYIETYQPFVFREKWLTDVDNK